MKKTGELKPCPFCGGEVRWSINEQGTNFIRCDTCDNMLLFGSRSGEVEKDKNAVAARWNRRAKQEDDDEE